MRATIRRALTWLLFGCILTIAVAVVGEWFIRVAEDKGWYAHAGRTWDRIVSGVLEFVTSAPVLYTVTGLTGLVAGVWLDTLLIRREIRHAPSSPIQPPEPTQRPKATAALPALSERRSDPALMSVFNPFSSEGFDYPYPKAVLQASFKNPKGTLEAGSDGKPFRLTVVMGVKNEHSAAIPEWCAVIKTVSREGDSLGIKGELKIARSYQSLEKGKEAQIPILYRDTSDQVSNPPFLLRFKDRDVPLKENANYLIGIELICGNKHHTDVLIEIRTGTGLEAKITMIHQGVSR